MFSVIIPTHNSERALVPTLAALVPGATAGIVREVIVTDAQSADQTEEVAEIAGCRFDASAKPLGVRLNEAAKSARGEWLMFLRPGCVPGITWIDEVVAFFGAELRQNRPRAAILRPETGTALQVLSRALWRPLSPEQGLILTRAFYSDLGGHPDNATPEASLLSRIGRRRLVTLGTYVSIADI